MRTQTELSKTERAVLGAVANHVAARGFAPTVREISKTKGCPRSTSHIAFLLESLRDKGLLRREPAVARGLALTPAGRRALKDMLEVL